ncbi:hypothetical protein [Flavobacterium caseinilyticum]|uniref:Uncharacterized protein n=1 Tax=Flavobacterium caseinilyticum TaxID=2541732 RepID=A0A4R5AQW9_9FLAO|nr:hypothetical protein [Flavobacterium caseinilyticum]TDD75301.1 hypothetical protein E0F89_13095 [Flavobacterium caseinilyticum]
MKKILFLIIVLFFGALLNLSTKQTDYNIENKFEDNKLLIIENNKKYWLQQERSYDKFNTTYKINTIGLLPIQTVNKQSSRHRKGKIVYSQK